MAWQTFELETGTNAPPRNGILDSHEVIWNSRTDPNDASLLNFREQQTLVFHVDCEPSSTTTNEFVLFMARPFMANPKVLVCSHGPTPGASSGQTGYVVAEEYVSAAANGFWRVERISVNHAEGGPGCRVSCVVSALGATWVDEEGDPVARIGARGGAGASEVATGSRVRVSRL